MYSPSSAEQLHGEEHLHHRDGPHSGKSIVALGFMEMLSARLQRIGFFRPIVRAGTEPDPQIELMRDRYQLQFELRARCTAPAPTR